MEEIMSIQADEGRFRQGIDFSLEANLPKLELCWDKMVPRREPINQGIGNQ
jgi:hypothetical protein